MAKSDDVTTLFDHLLDCANISLSIADFSPFDKEFREQLKHDLLFCALVHDVGKAASGFQDVMNGKSKSWDGKRHEILSVLFAATFSFVKEEQLFAIITHHKSILPDAATVYERTLSSEQIYFKDDFNEKSPILKEMQCEWCSNYKLFCLMWNELCDEFLKDEWKLVCVPNLNHIGLSEEWLCRSGRYSQKNISCDKRKYASILRGALISSDHLSSAKIKELPSPIKLSNFSFFSDDEIVRPFQAKSKDVVGDAILRAPTGSGKTKAALLWAAKNQVENGRLFYVLPYTASINAMYETMNDIFGSGKVGLLHHKNIFHLYDLQDGNSQKSYDAKLIADLAREIYYPIKVCTPHQILRGALRGKGWEHSLIEFTNACFVFDEIHAYEPRIVGLILGMVHWLKSIGSKVLFVSATMPKFLQDLIDQQLNNNYEMIELDTTQKQDLELMTKKRHYLEIFSGNIHEYVEQFISLSQKSNEKIMFICNHVSTAQELYRKIKSMDSVHPPVLFHSRYTQKDRNNIEKLIIKKQPQILIATQVIEVSLNLDYNICVTEAAPIDALIQRFGRVNRYGKRKPETVVVCETQVNSHHIYDKTIVERTMHNLKQFNSRILSEQDLVMITDSIYELGYNENQKDEFERALNYPDFSHFDSNTIAGTYLNWIDTVIEKTDQSIEVIPNELYEDYLKLREEKKWIEANMLFISLNLSQFKNLFLKNYIDKNDDVFVITAPYDSQIGLQIFNLPEKTYESAVFI